MPKDIQAAPPEAPSEKPAIVTADELATCIRVMESFLADHASFAAFPVETRRDLLVVAGKLSRPNRDEKQRMGKAFRRRNRVADREADAAALAQSALRVQRTAAVYTPKWVLPSPEIEADEGGPELKKARACYVCKEPYSRVHSFYDSMCAACGDFNYEKRAFTARLDGRVALVTGARVKIGFQAALKLLRAGAHVVITTRFPQDAAARYAREDDYDEWSSRVEIFGLDLRHPPSVEMFARYLELHLGRLDFILNNACQTVRRPPGFYAHLLEAERVSWSELSPRLRVLLASHEELKEIVGGGAKNASPALPSVGGGESAIAFASSSSASGIGVWGSAELSQVRLIDDDFAPAEKLFPRERYDEDLQQVDLRSINSWRLTMAQVPTAELLEVQLVNAVAPFILNARLKSLMIKDRTFDKHIVNVSAMEGQFYRGKKTDKHPHTNMAKAALNMMTRTSAIDYAKDGVYMNAVDTGWVTDEDPAVLAARKAELGFQPPLDIIDGAARICDPIFRGQHTGEHFCGQFLKDYKPAPW